MQVDNHYTCRASCNKSHTFQVALLGHVLTLLLLLGLPSQGVADFASSSKKDAFVLGMSAAFTGPSRGLGIELYRGSMAYFLELNSRGGIRGRKVEILPLDDGYNPTPAIENTLLFFQNPNITALFNYVGTPTVTRVLPLLKLYSAKEKFLFFPFTGAQPQRQEPYDAYVFNLRASYQEETEGLVNHFIDMGRKRIAVFYQADSYGRSGWAGVRRILKMHGLHMVGEATYARGVVFSDDMSHQVAIIKQSSPDAVISVGAYAACAAFIRDARDAGLNVPIANLSFVGSENLLKLLIDQGNISSRDYTRDLINSQVVPSYEDMRLPAVREYRELMDRHAPLPPDRYRTNDYIPLPYSFVSFEGFFNAKVMAHILDGCNEGYPSREINLVTESIHNLDIGIRARVRFSAVNHQGLDTIYYTTVKDGKFVPITDWKVWEK